MRIDARQLGKERRGPRTQHIAREDKARRGATFGCHRVFNVGGDLRFGHRAQGEVFADLDRGAGDFGADLGGRFVADAGAEQCINCSEQDVLRFPPDRVESESHTNRDAAGALGGGGIAGLDRGDILGLNTQTAEDRDLAVQKFGGRGIQYQVGGDQRIGRQRAATRRTAARGRLAFEFGLTSCAYFAAERSGDRRIGGAADREINPRIECRIGDRGQHPCPHVITRHDSAHRHRGAAAR